jgi:oligopeptide/dipeptide ABC transporter ATP-binding protein
MVFQEPYDSLNPRMTIADILEEPLRLAGRSPAERQQRARELMNMVRLEAAFLQRYPHQLTGGQQQRVGIARAIATEPALVVLDEPTSALDISVRAEIIWLLKQLQETLGLSYIFISHDLTAVREISHRVAIMYLGQIVEVGTNAQVFASQLHPYGQALLSSVLYPDPNTKYAQVTLKGEIPSPVHLPSGCFLHPRCPFVIEHCLTNQPALQEIAHQAHVACWRAAEFLNGRMPTATAASEVDAARASDPAT